MIGRDCHQVGAETGEKLWQMPLAAEYGDQVKSKIADLKNVGIRTGSSITAALFLKEFVDKVGLLRRGRYIQKMLCTLRSLPHHKKCLSTVSVWYIPVLSIPLGC